MMVKLSLPLEDRPWARQAAAAVILGTILALTAFVLVIERSRHLDVAEIVFVLLVLLAVLPPNIAILRRKPAGDPPTPHSVSNPTR